MLGIFITHNQKTYFIVFLCLQNLNIEYVVPDYYYDAVGSIEGASSSAEDREKLLRPPALLEFQKEVVEALDPGLFADDISHQVLDFYAGGSTGSSVDILVGSKGSYSCPHEDLPGRFATVLAVLVGTKHVWVLDKCKTCLHKGKVFVDLLYLENMHALHGGVLLKLVPGNAVVIDPSLTHAAWNEEGCISINMHYAPKDMFLEQMMHTFDAWPPGRNDLAMLGKGVSNIFVGLVRELCTDDQQGSDTRQKASLCLRLLDAIVPHLNTRIVGLNRRICNQLRSELSACL